MKMTLPITSYQRIDLTSSGDLVALSITSTGSTDIATATMEQDQLADLIEMLQLLRASRARRKTK